MTISRNVFTFKSLLKTFSVLVILFTAENLFMLAAQGSTKDEPTVCRFEEWIDARNYLGGKFRCGEKEITLSDYENLNAYLSGKKLYCTKSTSNIFEEESWDCGWKDQ